MKRFITLKRHFVKQEKILNQHDKQPMEVLVMTFKEPLWSSKCDPNDKSFYDTKLDHYQEQEDSWVTSVLGSENDVIADIIDSI